MPDTAMGNSMDLHCKKCCTFRTGDVLGAPCRTTGCDGVIEEQAAFHTLVDELPEPMTCGRRAENGMDRDDSPFARSGSGKDRWQRFKSTGDRVCSYCGSLHPEDFLALVKRCAESDPLAEYNSVVEIEQSDKGYKIYIHQPGVRNAHEGGIKFYTQHLPHLFVTPQQEQEFVKARAVSAQRFERYLSAQRRPKTA